MDYLATLQNDLVAWIKKGDELRQSIANKNRLPQEDEIVKLKSYETNRAELIEAIKIEKQAKDDSAFAEAPSGSSVLGQLSAGPNSTERRVGNGAEQFASFGDQLMAIRHAGSNNNIPVDSRLYEIRASGLSEGVLSDGGFLLAPTFINDLSAGMFETGVLAARVDTSLSLAAGSNSMKITKLKRASRVDGSRFGGTMTAAWEGEGATKTATQPELEREEINLKKLTGVYQATDELLEDATALEGAVTEWFGEEFGFKLDDAIVNGDGSGKPLGYINGPCLVTVAKETAQADATVVYENILKMWSRMPLKSRMNAIWVTHMDVEPQLHQMALNVGTGGAPVFLPPSGASVQPYSTLFGRPVIPIEQAQTLGTAGDIALIDPMEYRLVQKTGGIQAASSIHVKFLEDETTFRFVLRADGHPKWSSAVTPAHGSNTLSPFVILAARP